MVVGNYKVQEKCNVRIKEMIQNDITVLLASQSIDTVIKMCSRAILPDKGRIISVGSVRQICEVYKNC